MYQGKSSPPPPPSRVHACLHEDHPLTAPLRVRTQGLDSPTTAWLRAPLHFHTHAHPRLARTPVAFMKCSRHTHKTQTWHADHPTLVHTTPAGGAAPQGHHLCRRHAEGGGGGLTRENVSYILHFDCDRTKCLSVM